MSGKVILVDENDQAVGTAEKLEAHKNGVLHRAFSVFIFDDQGRLLLQKRAKSKYHSGGLWSNTCCSHPAPEEDTGVAAVRRLEQEMGLRCELSEIFSFTYKARLDHDLTEHEYDHVLVGISNEDPKPDPEEVEDWKWIGLHPLLDEIQRYPHQFTHWFRICLNRVIRYRMPEKS